ncbi:oxidoreductase, short chain dehydrogenase/reductase family [Cellvibrio japonicus Ueda107]|uniref:Oxidoreductase, short chain dehydrogenase/reductase family n=2 Tax=Cellvibrio japonicus TaxID=155077 RepID=B3PIJ0_CELJU|nr:oxidoreductase, short chain dehydrogenase/reductase family [Cellvibrio japonicus Ueda107]
MKSGQLSSNTFDRRPSAPTLIEISVMQPVPLQLPEGFALTAESLSQKVILVTGAGDGIGKVAATTFARCGATVILAGRTLGKLEQVYDNIESAGHPQAALFPINFEHAVEQDYDALCNALFDTFGRLDGILHNAADLGERTPISNYSLGAWQRCMQVNVNAPFMLTRALLPLLEKSPSASVLFTSSSVAFNGRAYWGGYAASKAAQENLMQTLADEHEGISRIRFNSINPGGTRTRMRAKAYPAEDPTSIKAPDALMPAYVYLLGDQSAGTSGVSFQYRA